jgi:hypothetical protein
MSRAQHILIPLVSLAALAAFQIPACAQTPSAPQIVHSAAGKTVPAVQPPKRNVGLQAAPKFLSWNEKVASLKAMNLFSGTGAAPTTVINLTVANSLQTVNGATFGVNYTAPALVYPSNGVAAFPDSTTMGSWGDDPNLAIEFTPLPNKRYLIDAPMSGNTGTYYIYVRVDDTTAFQQIMPKASRLLILFPGTAKSHQTSSIIIRGSTPGSGRWYWFGCQITEL